MLHQVLKRVGLSGDFSAWFTPEPCAHVTTVSQRQAAKAVLEKGLSVRQTEALVKALQKEKKEKPQEDNVLAIYLADIEKNLGSQLGRKVHIQHKGKKGKVELEYYSEDDLDALLRLLQYSQDGGDFS